jgi:hypothetical protein
MQILKEGEGIGFQIMEGPCSAGCEYCYERPIALNLLKKKSDKEYSNLDNRELAEVMKQTGFHFTLKGVEHYFQLFNEVGIEEAFLLGSEPTDHPDYDRIMESAEKYNIKITLYTSGKNIDKLKHSQINHIILHLGCENMGESFVEKINELHQNKIIDLRINFSDLKKEKNAIFSFYEKLINKNVLLKYSFTSKVKGIDINYVTPDNFDKKSLMEFVNEFKLKFPDVHLKAERSLFRCNFTDEEWDIYTKKGGFRSKCNMDFSIYPNKGLSLCPPARNLDSGRIVKNKEEFLQGLNNLRTKFEEIKYSPSFEICASCEFRVNHECQGGCGGYKEK